jgi:hypothetical protein
LHCADRSPRTYALKPGAGAVLLDAYRAELPAAGGSGTIAMTASVSWKATSDAWIALGGTSSDEQWQADLPGFCQHLVVAPDWEGCR